jgi:hypothetical protein
MSNGSAEVAVSKDWVVADDMDGEGEGRRERCREKDEEEPSEGRPDTGYEYVRRATWIEHGRIQKRHLPDGVSLRILETLSLLPLADLPPLPLLTLKRFLEP